jgi:hypothetical protein
MFDLDEAIAAWRQRMLGGGVKSPVPLDELESHLRDDVEQGMESGLGADVAFAEAVRRIGQAESLKGEFAKAGGMKEAQERVRRVFYTFAGIPNHYMTTDMNATDLKPNIEPGWVTYLKAGAFLLPALALWGLSKVFVVPKLQMICRDAGVAMPLAFRVAYALTEHTIWICGGFILAILLLEWRSRKWPQYRRATVGVGVFVLNSTVLILIFMMVILALLAVPTLMPHGK